MKNKVINFIKSKLSKNKFDSVVEFERLYTPLSLEHTLQLLGLDAN